MMNFHGNPLKELILSQKHLSISKLVITFFRRTVKKTPNNPFLGSRVKTVDASGKGKRFIKMYSDFWRVQMENILEHQR
jgi:hypothetical protein